jgi:hypothetical protein
MAAMPGTNNFGPIARRGAHLGAVLLLITGSATAGTIFKCVDASGAIAFQAVPCGGHGRQTAMQVRAQPLIDANAQAPRFAPEPKASSRKSRRDVRTRAGSRRGRGNAATSWECRAADGEVFYRHTHCPHSVPGDGVMRSTGRYVLRRGRGRRGGRDAWSPVSVHARKVPRELACRRINAVAAVERDGSARDEHASVYEHDLGRDPCAGY